MKCVHCSFEMIYKKEQRKIIFESKDYYYFDEYYECPNCGDLVFLTNSENEVHSIINRKIRDDNNMMQPDEITRRRIACGIGIDEFWYSYLSDIFPVCNSYWLIENGAVQSKEQDGAIRKALKELESKVSQSKRIFPLWIYGQDYRNNLEPQRLFWVIEMLCLDKPTTEEELYKKLIYFDSKNNNYTGAKYTSYENDYRLVYGNVILDYMVNVRKTLKIETINGADYYVSLNEPEYPAFEHKAVSDYEREKNRRVKYLEMLRNENKINLRLEGDYFNMEMHDAHQYVFKDIM